MTQNTGHGMGRGLALVPGGTVEAESKVEGRRSIERRYFHKVKSHGGAMSNVRLTTQCLPVVAIALMAGTVLLAVAVPGAQAQTYSVLHTFTDGSDGAGPQSGLTADGAGNFYGVAVQGGPYNLGVAFRFSHSGAGWTLSPIYGFRGGSDGAGPYGAMVFGPDGALYGTTFSGGASCNCGTVFKLTPPASVCHSVSCPWTETVLYRFSGPDGLEPRRALVFDRAGNMYGTTLQGGAYGWGVVYELSPSGNEWTESVLWNFTGGFDGENPLCSLLLDSAGNLYGTAPTGGYNNLGTVFELSPSGSGWSMSQIYSFDGQGNGSTPYGGLAFDAQGNLYGSTAHGGQFDAGVAFEMSPTGGGWAYTLMNDFVTSGPQDSPALDAAGNVYFVCTTCGYSGYDAKFTDNNGVWTWSLLHGFTGGGGATLPVGTLAFDASGNIYGMTYDGGSTNDGVIYEITP